MNQPPIDNQFVQEGCEQFSSPTPSDTPQSIEVEYIESGTFVGGEEDVYHAKIKTGETCVVLKKEYFARLSAEREKDVQALQDLVRLNHETYKAALAERDRQLAEVWKLLGIRNGAYDPGLADGGKPGFTANGTDFYGTAIQCLEATIADSQRQKAETERALVMATDAANKGDEARCKAGAMQDMIDDLKQQKAELEGRLKVAEDGLFACRTIADGCQQYDGRFERIIIEADHAFQSLRQSTQTEDKK